MSVPAEKIRCSYAGYLADNSGERYELLDGEVLMQAAPSPVHQEVSVEITRQLANFLVGKKCRVYAAPFDVRIFEAEGDSPQNVYTVFQPDISVICDPGKLDERGCKGAPDLIIEVLSPSTAGRDWFIKLSQYQKAGVREYWIADPQYRLVHVLLLKDGQYLIHRVYGRTETARVNVLEGCSIDLTLVFPEQAEN